MKEIFNKGKDAVGKAVSSTWKFVSDAADGTAKMYNESKVIEGIDYVSDSTSNQQDIIS